ncbi:MAG: S1-like domain-containing RNA-binding protein [bacterium]|nr:S1-like domain-containing RNA-binding protein [bacterium]
MIEIGRYNELIIDRETSVGLFLSDRKGNEVLLPTKYCPEEFEIDDSIEVFVYLDHEERPIATNIEPKIMLHEFAQLRVSEVNNIGAFMDWGLEKELLVPFSEQRQKMQKDRWYIVFLNYDSKTDRLYGSNKIEKWISNEPEMLTVEEGEEVELLIMGKSDIGYNVIINDRHKGLIYDSEIFEDIRVGDKLPGYIKKIRTDEKIDVSLQPIGYEKFNDVNVQLLYDALIDNNGSLELNDKSSPESIYEVLGISKKAFKKALGALYKDRKVEIKESGISLT